MIVDDDGGGGGVGDVVVADLMKCNLRRSYCYPAHLLACTSATSHSADVVAVVGAAVGVAVDWRFQGHHQAEGDAIGEYDNHLDRLDQQDSVRY